MQKLAEALRAKKGSESLRAVARELGVAPGTAEGWLKGWRRPDWPNLQPIAAYLEVPIEQIIEWLLEDDDPSSPIIHAPSGWTWFDRPIDVPVAA